MTSFVRKNEIWRNISHEDLEKVVSHIYPVGKPNVADEHFNEQKKTKTNN